MIHTDEDDEFERIERDAPKHVGGVIAEVTRGITVGGLMHGDGKQHWQRINRNGLNQVGNIHGVIVSERKDRVAN